MTDVTKTVKSRTGNMITVRELDPADQLDLFEACARNSTNLAWVSQALVICSVCKINDEPIITPSNPTEVKALARRLGKYDLRAAVEALDQLKEDDSALDVEAAKN